MYVIVYLNVTIQYLSTKYSLQFTTIDKQIIIYLNHKLFFLCLFLLIFFHSLIISSKSYTSKKSTILTESSFLAMFTAK